MVGHFFLAVVRNVRHHAPEFFRALHVDVIHTNSVTDNAFNVGESLQNAARNGSPLHQEHVSAAALLNDLVFRFAIRLDFFEGEACCLYDCSLQIDRRKNVVRDKNGWQLYLLICQRGRSSYKATDPALGSGGDECGQADIVSADWALGANQNRVPEPLHTVELGIVKYVR